jgi:CubicO group peptidase (beta-lactamase class C family)
MNIEHKIDASINEQMQRKHIPTAFEYVDTNYNLLGMIIHQLTGAPYDTFLQERIFGPLGMTATRHNDVRAIVANRAAGYLWENDQLRKSLRLQWKHINRSPAVPANAANGGLLSSLRDLIAWDAALTEGRVDGGVCDACRAAPARAETPGRRRRHRAGAANLLLGRHLPALVLAGGGDPARCDGGSQQCAGCAGRVLRGLAGLASRPGANGWRHISRHRRLLARYGALARGRRGCRSGGLQRERRSAGGVLHQPRRA